MIRERQVILGQRVHRVLQTMCGTEATHVLHVPRTLTVVVPEHAYVARATQEQTVIGVHQGIYGMDPDVWHVTSVQRQRQVVQHLVLLDHVLALLQATLDNIVITAQQTIYGVDGMQARVLRVSMVVLR